MKRNVDPFTQGGQTQLHSLHMIQQVITTTLKISLLVSFVFLLIMLACKLGFKPLYFVLAYAKAYFRVSLDFLPRGFFDTSWVVFHKDQWVEISDFVLNSHPEYQVYVAKITEELVKRLYQAGYFLISSVLGLSLYWVLKGKKGQETQVLKGYQLVKPRVLRKRVQKQGASNLKIADIPLPKGAETEHMMITGTTGAGKTNAIYSLLKQIKLFNHKAIILDTSGGFVSRFFDETKDLLLNPFDKRTQAWDLWRECSEEYDFDEFAESFIVSDNYDKFWSRAAQQLFSTAACQMKKNNRTSMDTLLDCLLAKPLSEIMAYFKGSFVSSFVDPNSEKMALGIRATLASNIRNLKYLEDRKNRFSIREWLNREDEKNWLFISASPTQREALKPLMSAWLSVAVKSVMALGENLERRVWIIIDELASLNKIPILMPGLSEVRRYGGCFIISFQDLHQLDAIYGPHIARTIGSLTGTKLVFRMDAHGAKQMAELFGEQEVLEPQESISFGAHQVREGISLTGHQKIRPLLSPADLMKLNNLEAYLKFPRNLPAAKIRFQLET